MRRPGHSNFLFVPGQTEAPTSRPPGPQMGRSSGKTLPPRNIGSGQKRKQQTWPSLLPRTGLRYPHYTPLGGEWGRTLRTGLGLQSTMHHGSIDPSKIIHSNCTVGRGVGVGWGFLFSQQLLLHHQSRVAIFSRSRCMAAVLARDDDRNVGWDVTFLYVFRGSRMSISQQICCCSRSPTVGGFTDIKEFS